MSEENKSWNEQLFDWIGSDPKRKEVLESYIPRGTLDDWKKSRVNNLDKMDPGRRAIIYAITGIEAFNFEGYVDPRTLDVGKIISGEQTKGSLPLWLGFHGVTKSKLARDAKVDTGTVNNYISGGRQTKPDLVKKIEKQLRLYTVTENNPSYDKREPAPREEEIPIKRREANDSGSNKLVEISSLLHNISGQLTLLGETYEPTDDTRKEMVAGAITVLVHQMRHYAGSDEETRKDLTQFLHDEGLVSAYGWADNVLRGLTARDGSAEAFARSFKAPEITRTKRRNQNG